MHAWPRSTSSALDTHREAQSPLDSQRPVWGQAGAREGQCDRLAEVRGGGHSPRSCGLGAAGSRPVPFTVRSWCPFAALCPGETAVLFSEAVPARGPAVTPLLASPLLFPCCSSPAPGPGFRTPRPASAGTGFPPVSGPSCSLAIGGPVWSLGSQGVLPKASERWRVTATSSGCLQPAAGGIVLDVGPFPLHHGAAPFWPLSGALRRCLTTPGEVTSTSCGPGWAVTWGLTLAVRTAGPCFWLGALGTV